MWQQMHDFIVSRAYKLSQKREVGEALLQHNVATTETTDQDLDHHFVDWWLTTQIFGVLTINLVVMYVVCSYCECMEAGSWR